MIEASWNYPPVCPNSSTNQFISASVKAHFKLNQDAMSGVLGGTGKINVQSQVM